MKTFLQEPGDLATVPLAAVLIQILNDRATGALQVDHDGGTSRIFVRDGIPVGSQSFTGFKPLGQILLARGRIDVATLNESLAGMAATGRPQGEVLVELGAVSRAEVDEALTGQQEAYLARIAALERGTFRFDGGRPVPEWTRGIRIRPLRAIVEAMEKPQAAALVASALRPAAGGPLALAKGYERLADAFGWSEADSRLVQRLATITTLDEFFAEPGVGPERARAVLAALLLLGLADTRAAGAPAVDTVPGIVVDLADLAGVAIEEGGAPGGGAGPGEPPPRRTPPMGSFSTPVPAAEPAPRPSVPRPARTTPALGTPAPEVAEPPAAPPAGPTPPGSTRPGARSPPPAPHPSTPRPSTPPPGQAVPERRSDPEEARRRRQRLLQRAMQNMGIGPFAGRPPPAAGAEPAAGPAPRAPAAPSAAELELRRAFEAAAPRARSPDLFTRLGLEKGAPRDRVKQAYFQLAKQFHPDRFLAPALADLAAGVKELFAALNEAYETLGDEKARGEWLARSARGPVAPTASAERAAAASIDFQKGEACLRTRDFTRARGFYEAAVRGHSLALYQAALAWALWFDPKAPDRARAKEALAAALRDPSCDRAAYTGAMMARDEGDDPQAEHLFRLALKANPGHVEAEREIRLIEARRRKR